MAGYTDKHVFVRVIKAGSAWLQVTMTGQFGAKDFGIPQHAPLSYVKEHFADVLASRTSFAIVRSPWDWYASWYLHLVQAAGRDYDAAEFRKTLYEATRKGTYLPKRPSGHPAGVNVYWDRTGDGKFGLCTNVFSYVAGGVDKLLVTDRVAEGLEKLLGEELQGQFRSTRNSRFDRAPQGLPNVKSYSELYDAEMIGWVAEADAGLIAAFGFEPFQPSPAAIYDGSLLLKAVGYVPAPVVEPVAEPVVAESSPEPVVVADVGAMEVTVSPGPDGELGTTDDVVEIKPKPRGRPKKLKA